MMYPSGVHYALNVYIIVVSSKEFVWTSEDNWKGYAKARFCTNPSGLCNLHNVSMQCCGDKAEFHILTDKALGFRSWK